MGHANVNFFILVSHCCSKGDFSTISVWPEVSHCISPAEGNGKSSARWWGTCGFLWVGAYQKDVPYFQQWIHDNSVCIMPSWKDYTLQDVRCGFHFLFPSVLTPFFLMFFPFLFYGFPSLAQFYSKFPINLSYLFSIPGVLFLPCSLACSARSSLNTVNCSREDLAIKTWHQ